MISKDSLKSTEIKTRGKKPDTKIGESIDKLLKKYYGKSFEWSKVTVTKLSDKTIGSGFIVTIEVING